MPGARECPQERGRPLTICQTRVEALALPNTSSFPTLAAGSSPRGVGGGPSWLGEAMEGQAQPPSPVLPSDPGGAQAGPEGEYLTLNQVQRFKPIDLDILILVPLACSKDQKPTGASPSRSLL